MFRTLLVWCLVLVWCGVSRAEPSVSVKVGWGGLHRVSEWTPVYVTLGGFETSSAEGTLEVWAYQDARYTVVHRAPVPLQKRATTFVMPVKMGSLVEAHSVVVRSGDTGKVLTSVGLGDLPSAEVQNIITATRLVGISGVWSGGVMPGDFLGGYVSVERLPEFAELYESLDLLVLTGDTLERMSLQQASAIAAWVRAGGRLLVCPPIEGMAAPAALMSLFPGAVGPIRMGAVVDLSLTASPGAEALQLPGGFTGVRGRVGFGWVGVLSTPLSVSSRAAAAKLVGEIKPRIALEPPLVLEEPVSSRKVAGVALVVLGLLAGLGEAVVRRAHNVWPWNWSTVAAVGVMFCGGVVWATAPRDGTAQESMSLVDQAGGKVVATARTGEGAEGAAFPRLLVPPGLRGTDHLTAEVVLEGSAPRLRWLPRSTGVLAGSIGPGPAELVIGVESGAVRVSAGVDELLLESERGVQAGRSVGEGKWVFDGSATATLPDAFRLARRLAPLRSGVLQSRITAGEARVVWTRKGNSFTRTLLDQP